MNNDGKLNGLVHGNYFSDIDTGMIVAYQGQKYVVTGWSQKLNVVFIARFVTALGVNPKDVNLEWDDE